MKRFHAFVALLLVALWLPASSHAMLELAGLIHEEAGHHDGRAHSHAHTHGHQPHHHDGHHHHHPPPEQHDHHGHSHEGGDHDVADGLCRIASSHVKAPVPSKDVPCWTVVTLIDVVAETASGAPTLGRSPPGHAPLEFLQQWQFSLRTALPVRAPSPVS